MKTNRVFCATLLFLVSCAVCGRSPAGEELVSTLEVMHAAGAVDGIRVAKAEDVPGTLYTEDYSISQVFEILRPDMGPVEVSRLATTCSCLRASMEKKQFAQGERALIEIRNVRPSVPGGAEYGLFVVLDSPYRIPLQAEVFVRSDRTPPVN